MSDIYLLQSTDLISQTFDDINDNFTNLNTDKADKVNWLDQFGSTTSTELASVLSDSIGTWPLVFGNSDGWISAWETWTYASATTFTIVWDQTSRYQRGDRIKLTQTTVKYFTVLKVAYSSVTTVTITGGTDYTLANAVISDNFYSKELSPQGYPDWFNYTPTWTGFSADPTVSVCKFSIQWSTCAITLNCSANGTSNTTGMTITTPNSITSVWQFYWVAGFAVDNSVTLTTVTQVQTNDTASVIQFRKTPDSSTSWTASGAKRANCTISFQFTL